MKDLKPQDDEMRFQEGFAILQRAVEKSFAERRDGEEPAASESDRLPKTAAEMDLLRAELTDRIQAAICADPRRCRKHRCRRLSRCRELEETRLLLEEQRALVQREREAAKGKGNGQNA